MYVSRAGFKLDGRTEGELVAEVEASHASRLPAEGFRWAMLLRSMDDASCFALVTMWLSPEHAAVWREATGTPEPHGYEVATARGAMTPAAAAALVDWEVASTDAQRFVTRWNAAYHAVEDVFGSRLLSGLTGPGAYTGLHVVTDASKLDPQLLGAQVSDSEGLAVTPISVERYEVVLLTEAS